MGNVLIVGGGGREAALEQAMWNSEEVERVIVDTDPHSGLAEFSKNDDPLVVIGPEAPLVAGLADDLRAEGYTVFGASKSAARYEASKSFTVEMMRRAGVLHPDTFIARDFNDAEDYIQKRHPETYVIKADGLAGGKGVVLPKTTAEALEVTRNMMSGRVFDGAGKEIVNFADRHHGPEVSAMVVVGDQDEFTILPIAQDHKRLGEGDTGPNTGGMGAYAPVPESILSTNQYDQLHEAVEMTLNGMRADGAPFARGLLYGGFMLSEEFEGRPVVIEYNVRFGDPETQAILPLVDYAGTDVYRLLRSAAEGSLEIPELSFSNLGLSALTVCLAAKGYPESPVKGDPIWGLGNHYHGVSVQEAGVKDDPANETTVTNGGRVLYVTGISQSLDGAAEKAYNAIDLDRLGPGSGKIGFEGMQVRRDIAHQARSTS